MCWHSLRSELCQRWNTNWIRPTKKDACSCWLAGWCVTHIRRCKGSNPAAGWNEKKTLSKTKNPGRCLLTSKKYFCGEKIFDPRLRVSGKRIVLWIFFKSPTFNFLFFIFKFSAKILYDSNFFLTNQRFLVSVDLWSLELFLKILEKTTKTTTAITSMTTTTTVTTTTTTRSFELRRCRLLWIFEKR